MAWYETQTCVLCKKTIGKRRFWQEKPRLVGPSKDIRDCAYVDDDTAKQLAGTHRLVCHDCYLNRFGEVQALIPSGG
jgi:hypothetical protein